MKDIGSIFPLYEDDLHRYSQCCAKETENHSIINYSLCREAIYAIAKAYGDSNRVALLPAYTCQTVIDPFIQQGWTCHFYNITKNLRIDIESLIKSYENHHPSLVIAHPYLGMELNKKELNALSVIKQNGSVLVEDLTQCMLTSSRPRIFDYFVGSYRKWIQIPDGGFVETRTGIKIETPTEESKDFVRKQLDSMYLRGQYFKTGNEILKEISIRLNKEAVNAVCKIDQLYRMSEFSSMVWKSEDLESVRKRRMENYSYLFGYIKENNLIKNVCSDISEVTTAPLYFPVYALHRSTVQKELADNHIYAPVLWPVYDNDVLINENIKSIYDTILMLPIDQRYDIHDMSKIANILNSYA